MCFVNKSFNFFNKDQKEIKSTGIMPKGGKELHENKKFGSSPHGLIFFWL
jgi:hypothetical protein